VSEQIDLTTPEGCARAAALGLAVPTVNRPTPEQSTTGTKESEKSFMGRVIAFAKERGWKVYHTFDSRRSEPGFLDLVCVRDRVLFMELKKDGETPTKAQKEWYHALLNAGALAFVFWPGDYETIMKLLE
jgi:hypothetical protein